MESYSDTTCMGQGVTALLRRCGVCACMQPWQHCWCRGFNVDAFTHVNADLWRYHAGLCAGSIASCWPCH